MKKQQDKRNGENTGEAKLAYDMIKIQHTVIFILEFVQCKQHIERRFIKNDLELLI